MVTGLFAGQHNTKLHGTITGVIWDRIKTNSKVGVALVLRESLKGRKFVQKSVKIPSRPSVLARLRLQKNKFILLGFIQL